MKSATTHAEQLQEKIDKEVQAGRVAGPFTSPPISNLRCSPIGIIPKKQGGWRMICNLSAPQGQSINDWIDPAKCSVQYSSFDKAIELVSKIGKGALIGKKDIANAFRLMPIRPEDFCLLGFQFQDKYYFDKSLPFGCSIACATFEKFSSFLNWLVEHKSNSDAIQHYLDDFLFVGPKETNACKALMETFDNICGDLGVPVSHEKTEGPTTLVTYLGLGIDSIRQAIYVPPAKIPPLLELINHALGKHKITLRELQSLVGSLAFVTKAIPGGRAFCRRLYAALGQGSKPHHFIRISPGMREDLGTWAHFLQDFNGTCTFPNLHWASNEEVNLWSDSAGARGCGVVYHNHWSYIQWPTCWPPEVRRDITFLELVPIVMAIFIWGACLQGKKLTFHVDNQAVVSILNEQTSTSPRIMCLLRPLILKSLHNNMQIRSVHVFGRNNKTCDAISRFQWSTFRQLAPTADPYPSQIPKELSVLLNQKFTDC